MKQNYQSGQIVVLLLLIMLVGLTIGLSITSRTLQQMKVTSVTEQSSRAYSGAEAAIEAALKEDLAEIVAGHEGEWQSAGDLGSSVISRSEYMVEEEDEFILTVQKDEVAQVNLSGFAGDQMDVYWVWESDEDENPDPGEEPGRASLELTFIKNEGGSYSVIRFALNADNRVENGFTQPGGGTDTSGGATVVVQGNDSCGAPISGYCNKAEITDLADLEILRIKPFYNKATVWVDSAAAIPTQLYTVSGEATTVADITRRVEVTKAPPALPPVFDYVLFDGSGNPLQKK